MSPVTPDSPSILRAAARRLRTAPLPATFALKEKFAGARFDLNALSGRGWRMLTWLRGGEPQLWAGCVWLERVLPDGHGTSYLFHVSFGPANPDDMPAALRRQSDFPAFLRRIHVFVQTDDGLDFEMPPGPPPGDVLHQLSLELGEAVLEGRAPLARDMAALAKDYGITLPEWDGPDVRNLAIVENFAWDEWKEGHGDSVERLLVPAVAAVAHPAADPEGARILREFPLQSILWRILYLWLNISDEAAAMKRFLAFLLERALDDDLDEPLDSRGWTVLATALVEAREHAAAVIAFEHAIATDQENAEFPEMLWSHLQRIANAIGAQSGKGRRPDGLRELVRILVANEEILARQPGYWGLLGLLFLLHGEPRPLVASTLRKSFPVPEDGRNGAEPGSPLPDGAGTDAESAGSESADDTAPPAKCVAEPLLWQCLRIGSAGLRRLARHQLAVFPAPALSIPARPFDLPQEVIVGVGHEDMWRGIDPDFRDHVRELTETVVEKGRFIHRPESLSALQPHEVSDENGCDHTEISRPASRGREIIPLLSIGSKASVSGKYTPELLRLIPLARPAGTPKNVALSLWRTFPYDDNGCGEGFLRLPDNRPICAVLPFFASDRNAVPRGLPCPAFLYATALGANVLGKASDYTPTDGSPAWVCSLDPQQHDASRAVHTVVGVVRSVRRVAIRGIARGGTLLRLDLDLFHLLPCRLPVYLHESAIRDHDRVRRGDVLAATALLYADLFSPPGEEFEAWLAAHPDGPGPEPDYVSPTPHSVLEEFSREPEPPKRDGDGKEDDEDGNRRERLTPDNMDVIRVALHRLLAVPECEDCRVWLDNPTAAQIVCRIGGEIRRYRVFRRMGDEPGPAPDDTPPGVAPLVVRIVPDRKVYRVVYEGFPGSPP